MKSLYEVIQEMESLNIPEVIVDGIIVLPTIELAGRYENLIIEKKDKFPQIPGTRYMFRKDNPRGIPGPGNQMHIHIYAPDGEHLYAINIDGTAHDGSHGAKIDKDIAKFLKSKGIKVPDNRIIEWYPEKRSGESKMLLCD